MGNYERINGPSPVFQWTNSTTISAGEKTGITWAEYDKTSAKYLPFDTVTITNNGDSDFMFFINQEKPLYCPKGTIQNIPRTVVPALNSFLIENLGTADITAKTVYVTCSKGGVTGDSIFSSMHQKIFGGLNRGNKI